MTGVPAELDDLLQKIQSLTQADQLAWRETGEGFLAPAGGDSFEVSLASGQWLLTKSVLSSRIDVEVRNERGDLIYSFTVLPDDARYMSLSTTYETARRQALNARTTLENMRQELAGR